MIDNIFTVFLDIILFDEGYHIGNNNTYHYIPQVVGERSLLFISKSTYSHL